MADIPDVKGGAAAPLAIGMPADVRDWFALLKPRVITLVVYTGFAGFYYWFPKMTGYVLPEWIGKLHFWLAFIGANVLFFPMHFLGLAGMPRRYPDYPDAFAGWNYVASIGAYIGAASVFVFLYVLYRTFTSKVQVADNYWGEGATTLEWTVTSPPPFHTFEELPRVR